MIVIHSTIVNNFAAKPFCDCVCYCLLCLIADNIIMFIKIINMNCPSIAINHYYFIRITPTGKFLRRILIPAGRVITINALKSYSNAIPVFCVAFNLIQHITNQLATNLFQLSFFCIFMLNNTISEEYYGYQRKHLFYTIQQLIHIFFLLYSASKCITPLSTISKS